MKTVHLFSASLAAVLLATQTTAATDIAAGWNTELKLAQQAYNQGADGRARADAMLGAVYAAVQNGVGKETPPIGADLDAATVQAAYFALAILYPGRISALDAELAESLAKITGTPATIAAGREWGSHVAEVVIAEQDNAELRDTGSLAASVQSTPAPVPIPVTRADQAATSPVHYKFKVLAGAAGTKGYVDGQGAAARFDNPGGIAVDALDNVYVSEQDLGIIRKISAGGAVTTLAGAAGVTGLVDGIGPDARFNRPTSLAVDRAGNVYVADTGNRAIRKIDGAGKVTTFFIDAATSAAGGGTTETSGYISPAWLAVDDAGNVFFNSAGLNSDWLSVIRKITPDGIASVIYSDSYYFDAICIDHTGKLYVEEYDAWSNGTLTLAPTTAGQYASTGFPGNVNGSLVGIDEGNNLYLRSFSDADQIYRIAPDGGVQVGYATEENGKFTPDVMTVNRSGKIFSFSYPYRSPFGGPSGAIDVGTSNPDDAGPIILHQPVDQASYPDKSATFEVQAIGGPTLAYQWYFNGAAIRGATSSFFHLDTVTSGDAGRYSVVVSDSAGSVTSNGAALTVLKATTEQPPSGVGGSTPGAGNSAAASTSSGGGSFELGSALGVLLLLAAAAGRRRQSPRAASA